MTYSLGAVVVALAVAGTPMDNPVVPSETYSIAYDRTQFEAACGATVFRARFRNVPGLRRRGRVERVAIGRRSLSRMAEQLDVRAAGRWISAIEIMNCGWDAMRPVFQGVLRLPEPESRALSLSWNVFFTIRRGPEGWSLTFD